MVRSTLIILRNNYKLVKIPTCTSSLCRHVCMYFFSFTYNIEIKTRIKS